MAPPTCDPTVLPKKAPAPTGGAGYEEASGRAWHTQASAGALAVLYHRQVRCVNTYCVYYNVFYAIVRYSPLAGSASDGWRLRSRSGARPAGPKFRRWRFPLTACHRCHSAEQVEYIRRGLVP